MSIEVDTPNLRAPEERNVYNRGIVKLTIKYTPTP